MISIQHGRKLIGFDNEIHEVYANKNTVKFDDGETLVNTYAEFTSGESNCVFCIKGQLKCAKIKLYYLEIYDNEKLVRDYIPVLDDDGIACLYDKVEKKFYYNEGTGAFIAGPEV